MISEDHEACGGDAEHGRLTQGAIKRDGTQLRRPMPQFRMTPQDAADVVAYLRSW